MDGQGFRKEDAAGGAHGVAVDPRRIPAKPTGQAIPLAQAGVPARSVPTQPARIGVGAQGATNPAAKPSPGYSAPLDASARVDDWGRRFQGRDGPRAGGANSIGRDRQDAQLDKARVSAEARREREELEFARRKESFWREAALKTIGLVSLSDEVIGVADQLMAAYDERFGRKPTEDELLALGSAILDSLGPEPTPGGV